MKKAIGDVLFTAQTSTMPTAAYRRTAPDRLGLRESWFRDAIFADPELVIGPCRASNLVADDEQWYPWAKEFRVTAGPIDVLLVSSLGRLGVVETKLSYNPERRREVVAQVLDYALALQDAPREHLPDLPVAEEAPEPEDVSDCLQRGDFLLVVAGDAMDPRALRLAESLFARHLTSEWNLSMIDLNLYESVASPGSLLIVPEARGVVLAETRQVVRVAIEGTQPRARVTVERIPSITPGDWNRKQKLESDEAFLDSVARNSPQSKAPVGALLMHFRQVQLQTHDVFRCQLQSTSANLYWNVGDKHLRIFALSHRGDLIVRLGYLQKGGRGDVVAALRELLTPAMKIPAGDMFGKVQVTTDNIAALKSLVDAAIAVVVKLAGQG